MYLFNIHVIWEYLFPTVKSFSSIAWKENSWYKNNITFQQEQASQEEM